MRLHRHFLEGIKQSRQPIIAVMAHNSPFGKFKDSIAAISIGVGFVSICIALVSCSQ